MLNVEHVYHRKGAIWPFTVVGRPPQEDTCFGQIIHELTGPIIPTVVAGVHAVHAVDAAGVHPLLLAIGSERYVPYAQERKPQELLTCANAILGQGQLSLAKYLFIVAHEDNPDLDIHDIPAFFRHVLERADWRTDLHFRPARRSTRSITREPANAEVEAGDCGSGRKVAVARRNPSRREALPEGFTAPRVCLPGVVAIQAPKYTALEEADLAWLSSLISPEEPWYRFRLLVLVDDSDFTARTLNNFLWVTFTRSNPAADVHGSGAFVRQKHWGCTGPLVIDARIKPHHAPPLEEDPAVAKRVEALAVRGGPLFGII